ncbi:aspartate/glutamate racemase family protein [Sinorhizobium meliloti]|uniref:aspartate/glutamate racemase family protein n=1 Tax=Rhizobium meliloti TaxID=382 RepID=UPI00299D4AEB|nr:aspartate/glutamate racemase family protein [Sinorhizobium meliloti]MDW9664490.1 aspartate/glutamate racemase family protein [Sinorhizobium meliloti]MDX0054335.1 aspartate/glutamate racemase family protein [Sinorhizobium meliloti]
MSNSRTTVHGTIVGVIVLDTGFRRLPGDIAHAATWPFPVQFRIVRGVRPRDVIEGNPRHSLDAFRAAIDDLVALGCTAITTSCGFLAALQGELTLHSPVPFLSSALLQIPMIEHILPAGKKPGLILSDRHSITERHLHAVGAAPGLPMAALPVDGPLLRNMREQATEVDAAAQEADVMATVAELMAHHSEVGALVFECANLPPYSAAVSRRFGLPVFDIVTLVRWMQLSLAPPDYFK